MPIFLAVCSLRVDERNFVFTRAGPPEGRGPTLRGMGGSPSFFSRLSAITRKARRPMIMRWGARGERREEEGTENHTLGSTGGRGPWLVFFVVHV